MNQVAAIFVKDTPRQGQDRPAMGRYEIVSELFTLKLYDMPKRCLLNIYWIVVFRILLVPAIQAMIGILWILLWALSASFLISQVPDGYIPKAAGSEQLGEMLQ